LIVIEKYAAILR